MIDELYLNIYLSPAELNYDIKKIIKDKLAQRFLFKDIDGRMITNIELNNLKHMPLSKTSINTIELIIPVKINYKT